MRKATDRLAADAPAEKRAEIERTATRGPGPFFSWPRASPRGRRPPKSGRPRPNSPISIVSCFGFLRERTMDAELRAVASSGQNGAPEEMKALII